MKIKSIAILRKDLNPNTRKVLITKDFGLPLEKTFTVYSISIWHGVLNYLIVEDGGRPFWFPSELFVVEDALLPNGMYHKHFGVGDERGLNALWGYKEMVLDDQHYIDLIERESDAEEIFFKRKNEIDDA